MGCPGWIYLRAGLPAVAHLTALAARSFRLSSQCSFHPLGLTKRKLLPIALFHCLCDEFHSQFLGHFEKLRHSFDQELQLAGFRPLDRLGHLMF
jgi:hypothetical protein